MRLDYALEGFWLSKRRNYSPHTIADYELTFRRLREFVGEKEVEEITSTDLNHFLEHLAKKLNLAPKTIMNHWIALSSFWTWASGELKIPHIVRDHVERPKVTRRQSQPYARHEVQAMIDACERAEAWDSKNGRQVTAKRPTGPRDKLHRPPRPGHRIRRALRRAHGPELPRHGPGGPAARGAGPAEP